MIRTNGFGKRLLALMLAGCLTFGSVITANAAVNSSTAIAKGIDVSKWQGLIDWAQVAASGVSFAFIKLGSTYSGIDPYFDYNMKGAQMNGLKTGVYVYSYAKSVEEAAAEAAMMVQTLEPYMVSMPVVLDLEDDSAAHLDMLTLQTMCYTFYQILDLHGYYPMIYANKHWFENKIGNVVMDKWVAQFNTECNYNGTPAFWQSSETGLVPGIGGYVDIDYQYKDLSGLIVPFVIVPRPDGNARFYLNYKMQRGWIDYLGFKYLADPLGNLIKGFYADTNGTYYFNPETYQAALGVTQVGDQVFYFDEKYHMKTGLMYLGDGVYFFDRTTGAMAKGLVMDIDGNFYYAGTDGRLQNGFVTIDGNNFLFDLENFTMIRNTVIPGAGFNYVIDGNGIVTEVPVVPEVPEVITIPVATAKHEVALEEEGEEASSASSDSVGTSSGTGAGSVSSAYRNLKPVNVAEKTAVTSENKTVTEAGVTETGVEDPAAAVTDAKEAEESGAANETESGTKQEKTEENSSDEKKDQTVSTGNTVDTPAQTEGNTDDKAALTPATQQTGEAESAGEGTGEGEDAEGSKDPEKSNEDALKPEQPAEAEPEAE